jgi:site-specific DNA-methyltransferase (adenine-specific)
MSIELFHGDCLEVMKTLPDRSIDLFMCDLPYACLDKKGAGADGMKAVKRGGIFAEDGGVCYGFTNPWDVLIPWEPFWKEVRRLRKNAHSVVLFFCQGKFMADAICSNKEEFRLALVWDKVQLTNFFDANRRPCYNHEQILVFAEKSAYYNRVNYEGKCPTTIIRIDARQKLDKTRYHPTEKHVELYKRLVSWYCPPGGTMLDPTAGSCNSLVAAGLLGMNAIGIERDDTFYEKGVQKITALTLSTP